MLRRQALLVEAKKLIKKTSFLTKIETITI